MQPRRASAARAPWFTCPEAGTEAASARSHSGDCRSRLEPLSAERYRVEFTASAALRAKIEHARELTSHAVPNGDLALLFERALDGLIERELKRRIGAGKPRRSLKPRRDSRPVPLTVAREVRERDGNQCTFVDSEGRRCQERRFLTLEHRHPFALGGPDTPENLCLLCKGHNAYAARNVFGDAFIARKITAREAHSASVDVARRRASKTVGKSPTGPDVFEKVRSGLTQMGFPPRAVTGALTRLHHDHPELGVEALLRAALSVLTPHPP